MTEQVLALTADMPERVVPVGADALEGIDGAVAVLVSGRLRVSIGDAELSRMDVPGSFVGEIGALLGTPRSAQVTAVEPTLIRVIGDPTAFFRDHPELGLELARQLAGRLYRISTYLADLREQYGDREDHLGLVDSVLGRIANRPPVQISPGSVRSPDY